MGRQKKDSAVVRRRCLLFLVAWLGDCASQLSAPWGAFSLGHREEWQRECRDRAPPTLTLSWAQPGAKEG